MYSLLQQIRTGDWLTPERVRGYALLMLVIAVAGFGGWIALSHNMLDPNGKPIGTDFASFYAAGTMVRDGHAAAVYDSAAHYARQQQIFGSGVPYYAWLYPPLFLTIATPLALMPYPLALFIWQASTLLLYLAAIAAIVRSFRSDLATRWLLPALAFPAVFINLAHGQNGLLTAALFGGALVALPARPILAGVLFGLLAYKPQFGLVIPLALLASGQWRAIFGASVTVVLCVAATALLFGFQTWTAFLASTDVSRIVLLEQGSVGYEKLQSVFAAVRMWGGSVPLAYGMQGVVTLMAVAGTVWVWRLPIDHAQKAAVLVIATLLASPHVLDYDLTVLATAIAFMAMTGITRGFRPYEITLLAAAWAVPLVSRGIAGETGVPLGLLAMLALFALAMRRALADPECVSQSAAGFARA